MTNDQPTAQPVPPAAKDDPAEHVRGPWLAVLTDRSGFVYDSVEDACENADDPDDDFEIAVVRGTSMPNNRSGDRLRLPGSILSGDKAYELDDVYLEDTDPSVSASARLAQAQAMAAGLNAAWGGEQA